MNKLAVKLTAAVGKFETNYKETLNEANLDQNTINTLYDLGADIKHLMDEIYQMQISINMQNLLLNLLFSRMFSASMKIQPKQQKKLQSFSILSLLNLARMSNSFSCPSGHKLRQGTHHFRNFFISNGFV